MGRQGDLVKKGVQAPWKRRGRAKEESMQAVLGIGQGKSKEEIGCLDPEATDFENFLRVLKV